MRGTGPQPASQGDHLLYYPVPHGHGTPQGDDDETSGVVNSDKSPVVGYGSSVQKVRVSEMDLSNRVAIVAA